MITRIHIDGFKTFQDFEMYFSPFTIIAGTNASGKSNLFDVMNFLSDLARGMTIKEALHRVRGEEYEAFTIYHDGSQANTIAITVDLLVDSMVTDMWEQKNGLDCIRLRYSIRLKRDETGRIILLNESLESIPPSEDKWLKMNSHHVKFAKTQEKKRDEVQSFIKVYSYLDKTGEVRLRLISFQDHEKEPRIMNFADSKRTFLSLIDTVESPHIFAARKEMSSWCFLQLNPSDLRRPSEESLDGYLDPSGDNLAGVLMYLKQKDPYYLKAISRLISRFLPNYVSIDVGLDHDSKRYIFSLKDIEGRIYTSRVLSEGTLRIIALCMLSVDESAHGVIGLEEPENGIHPFRVASMTKLINDLTTDFERESSPLRQVIVNTHSPLFVIFSQKFFGNRVLRYMSRLVTGIYTKERKKVKVMATKMTPLISFTHADLLGVGEEELKMANITDKEFIKIMGSPNNEETL